MQFKHKTKTYFLIVTEQNTYIKNISSFLTFEFFTRVNKLILIEWIELDE